MRMESEDIRNLPLHMQEQVAMAILPPAAELAPVAGLRILRRIRFPNKRAARRYLELRELATQGFIDAVTVHVEDGIVRSVSYVVTEDCYD